PARACFGARQRARSARDRDLGRRASPSGGLRPGRARAPARGGRLAGGVPVGVRGGRPAPRLACPARPSRRLDRSAPRVIHEIPLERRTLHGHFSRDLPPVLTIDSDDTVAFSCLDSAWHVTPAETFEPRDEELDAGHALIGPIELRGAPAGAHLAVRSAGAGGGPAGA